MKNYYIFLFSALLFQWVFVNGASENEYSNEYFKSQLDSSFKKYFNDNIYKIKEYSKEKRLFNKRQESNKQKRDDEYKELSCDSDEVKVLLQNKLQLTSIKLNDIDNEPFKSMTASKLSAYFECDESYGIPNYGNLFNSIVLKQIKKKGKESTQSITDVVQEIKDNINLISKRAKQYYTTEKFISQMQDSSTSSVKTYKDKGLVETNYSQCLNLVKEKILTNKDVSNCLCSYGYGEDIKLKALYLYYGIEEEEFGNICANVEKSDFSRDENKFLFNLPDETFEKVLQIYNIPNYGKLFNKLVKSDLNLTSSSTDNIKKIVYRIRNDFYETITNSNKNAIKNNQPLSDDEKEVSRCINQVINGLVDNKDYSYCLCKGGLETFGFDNQYYRIDIHTVKDFSNSCEEDLKNRDKDVYPGCRVGKDVKSCFSKKKKDLYYGEEGALENCIDTGILNYRDQNKCLCDLYNATWVDDEFLSCYGHTELSFTLSCREFYPNQMYSDDPNKGIENYNSEDYDEYCGDSVIGGSTSRHDKCICDIRSQNQEVSLELDSICSRIKDKIGTCSEGFLSFKFSLSLITFTSLISLFLYF